MDYQVAISPSARRDLRDIVRYISLDSPDRGLRFGQLLLRSVKHLATVPNMGRIVPEFEDPQIREIVVRGYRVIYRVDHVRFRVDVARFWHGARTNPRFDNL